MKKIFAFLLLATTWTLCVQAQRATDKLDRGLVAVKVTSGVYLSWRIQADEYYDVTYNVYKNGTLLNPKPLTTSNYTDRSGTKSASYTVRPVIRGVEGTDCKAVTSWTKNYKELTLSTIISADGTDVTANYQPNDICPADVDGDGEVELIVKRLNFADFSSLFLPETKDYTRIEIYKLDGTLLWWIDCGPNMFSMNQMETNAIAYDWDEDGRAELLMRVEDGAVIHKADGTTVEVGNMNVNYRSTIAWRGVSNCYETQGTEYLLYLDGQTGEIYEKQKWPLPRTLLPLINHVEGSQSWGDAYGHRANKHFFAAPFLDGKRASMIFCRGIYTSIFMKAFDVDPATHKLTQRWSWQATDGAYYAQGFHNFGIADVDLDGRDEIVYGSMVVDDNGKGLSSTSRGHGDAQHCGDLDPYRYGQELFTCHEHHPGSMLRNATTSEVYYNCTSDRDDGRCMAGNFSNTWPGCLVTSSRTNGYICSVDGQNVGSQDGSVSQNMRIYWDGDLCEETFDYTKFTDDTGIDPEVRKFGRTKTWSFSGCRTSGSSKGNAALIGDILGDWREEVLLRTPDGKLRIYTTTESTNYRIPSLWYDHQYRQGMLWEQMGYNQPPHVSFFLGQLEGITQAPPPYTLTGRTLLGNGSTINTTNDHLFVYDTQDITVNIADGASPYMLTVNVPSWTQGSNFYSAGDCSDGITTEYYTTTLSGGAFTGSMRLVKQGEGKLVLPDVIETYTGETNVWNGTLDFDGTMENSPVWLNRFTTLETSGTFHRSVIMEYGSRLCLKGSVIIDTLNLHIGARMVFNIDGDDANDKISIKQLTVEKKTWQHGPQYLVPVIELCGNVQSGIYELGTVENIVGKVENIIIEGVEKGEAYIEDGKLMVKTVGSYVKNIHGNEVTAGSFYLYNVKKNVFYEGFSAPATLTSGASYPLKLTGSGNKFSMKGEKGYIKTGYWMDIYTWPDGTNAVRWTFEPVEGDENTYTISYTTAITEGDSKIRTREKWYLCVNGNNVSGTINPDDPTIHWRLVTRDDIEESESDYARYRIENGMAAYESSITMNLTDWITNGTASANNGDNLWYVDQGHMVKWGVGSDNYAYRRFIDMPAGKYTLKAFVRSNAGQQLFLSTNDATGTNDLAVKTTTNNSSGTTVTLTFTTQNNLPELCFGIRDREGRAANTNWCDFHNVILSCEPFDPFTGITKTVNGKSSNSDCIYDLSGRRVNSQLKRGIYITKGRKIIVK